MHSVALFESHTGTDPITKHGLWIGLLPCFPLAAIVWHKGEVWAALGLLALVACIAAFSYWAASAIIYTVNNGTLTIKGVFSTLHIASSDIADAKMIELQPAWRTFGIGGINCYQGRFYNRQLGDFELYARTYQGPAVLLTLHDGGRIVLTPKDRSEFLRALGV